jgi:hypothetical protein
MEQNVVVGLEADLREDARVALSKAREKRAGLSIRQFMSGFGPQRVNDPEALWDSVLLGNLRSNMTITLMCAVLFGVMTLFWALLLSKYTIGEFVPDSETTDTLELTCSFATSLRHHVADTLPCHTRRLKVDRQLPESRYGKVTGSINDSPRSAIRLSPNS